MAELDLDAAKALLRDFQHPTKAAVEAAAPLIERQLREQIEWYQRRTKALESLLAHHRSQRQPSEKLHKELEATRLRIGRDGAWLGDLTRRPADAGETPRRAMKPTLGRIVHYRGKHGVNAMRAAIVTATVDTLDRANVAIGAIADLDSDQHIHLWVFTPGEAGGFTEYNVPHGLITDDGIQIPPGTWMWPPRT